MKNFEKAQILIEELQQENARLKEKISKLTEPKINIQVDSSCQLDIIERERIAAMEKFTEKMRNEARKYKEKRDG